MAEKLLIKNEDKGEELRVQFNPERYAIDDTASWEGQDRKSGLQYRGRARKSITLELFFDSYGEAKDVRKAHVQALIKLTEPTIEMDTGERRPPVLLLSWGGFSFKCVLEKVSQNYTMFLESGIPVRAVLNATFKEFTTAEEEARSNPPGDPTKVHMVKQGETLCLIAYKEYGDPTLWRLIAQENRMDNPDDLSVGRALAIPALE